MGKDVAWETTTSQAWFETVEGWTWERQGRAWVKQGPCPECEHPMDRTLTDTVRLAEQQPVEIWCNCDATHEGRPEGKRGCGKIARISPPPETGE
jgi:hypothetical protein